MLALLSLIAAFALMPAAASAFSADSFSVTPSSTQAAAHPNVNVKLTRGGADTEDIKNVVVDLAPGIVANTNAVTTKCAATSFTSDRCSSTQKVGTLSTDIVAIGFLPMTANGDIYMLTPLSTDAATLGYVIRPSIGSKLYVKNNITVNATTDYSLRNSHISLPTTTKVLGITTAFVINGMELNLNSKAPSGKYFMLNTSSCGTATSKLSMTSYQNVTVSRTHSFNAACSSVPFAPTFAETFTVLNSEKNTATTATLSQTHTDAVQQESTIKKAAITYPKTTGLNFTLLNSLTGCTNTQFLANSCPAASKIGTASATVPILGSFTGSIYALDPVTSNLNFGVYLAGPRGVKAFVRGDASVQGVGPDQRVVATVNDAPPFPISSFQLAFTSQLLTQPETCGTQTVNALFTGHSGGTINRPVNYTTVNCAPETNVTASPASPSNDNTPAFSFTATPSGGTFQCAFDSGAFSTCTSGQSFAALSDGSHLFRVRACNAVATCDHTPAEYSLTVDTAPPALAISAPSGTVGTSNVSVVFDAEDEATTSCKLDAGAYATCGEPSYTFIGVADGNHTISVQATDAAGNVTTKSTAFTVTTVVINAPDTQIDDGPRGGLKITDQTPTFDFSSSPAGAPAFECSIDGGSFTACGSPLTVDPLEPGEHTLAVRAIGDTGDPAGSTDPSPAVASFEVGFFEPAVAIDYLDNQNNALPNTKAAQHPDVDVTFDNPAGDPDQVSFQLPDGFWGSLGAATQCPLYDVSEGTCTSDSKIGTAELTAVTNANESHTFTSDVYLTESPGGALAGLAANLNIAFDGKDYGYLRDDALFNFEARYVREDADTANVHDPRGVNATANSLPNSTAAHPGPDGLVTMHVRQLKVHLDGDTGESIGKPLLTAPSYCEPYAPSGEPMQFTGAFLDKEGNTADLAVPYQATDCETVPFDPTLVQSYSPVVKGQSTVATAQVTVPDQHSTIRNLVLDLPISVQPQFAGLASACQPSDTRLIPPACNPDTTLVGTASIETPLLGMPIYGEVYLEDSGNALPNLYIYVYDNELGLDVRLRGASETIGYPANVRFRINAEQDGSVVDAPDIPITSLEMLLDGSSTNGPILKITTACRKVDSTSSAAFTGWTGATATVSQTMNFDPNCPN